MMMKGKNTKRGASQPLRWQKTAGYVGSGAAQKIRLPGFEKPCYIVSIILHSFVLIFFHGVICINIQIRNRSKNF